MADTQSISLSDLGHRRHNNEDFAAYFEPTDAVELKESGSLYIVADGVGGAAKGERASQFAAQKVLYEYYQQPELDPGERLRNIIEHVNDDIHTYAEENSTRMATTIVAAVVRSGLLYLANVGDSRAYLIRAGEVKQLSRDHSLVGEMVAHGEMTEAEAMASKIKNRLTRSLGGDPEVHVEVYNPLPLKAGDKILLCSDGLTRYALREDIYKMTQEGTPDEIAKRLIQFANGRGGVDNISVVVVAYQGSEVLEPTIRIDRPPKVEDLETYHTLPDISKSNRLQRNQLATLVNLAMLVVGMLIFTGLLIGMNFSHILDFVSGQLGTPSVTVTALASTTPTTPTLTPEKNNSDLTVVQSTKEALSPIPTIPPSNTPNPTATSLTIPITPISVPSGNDFCLGEVTADRPTLSQVFSAFGKKFSDYSTFSRCSKYDPSIGCQEIATIRNPHYVYDGYLIIVPDVGEGACMEKGGEWVRDAR